MKLAIFDLGNVVIKIDFMKIFAYWEEKTGIQKELLAKRFAADDPLGQFVKGQITPSQYHAHVNKMLDVSLSYENFEIGWNAIFEEIMPETLKFISSLKPEYHVIGLTNTNVLHCEKWQQLYEQDLSVFSTIYSSHEIGMQKPDREIFEYVLRSEACVPEEAIFFDDSRENIEAASKLGITSYHVDEELSFIEKFQESLH